MNAYRKYLTIEDPNSLVLSDLPFISGQRVEIIILSDEESTVKKSAKIINSEEFLAKANQAYADLRKNSEAWQEELAERELWEQTIGDGVIED